MGLNIFLKNQWSGNDEVASVSQMSLKRDIVSRKFSSSDVENAAYLYMEINKFMQHSNNVTTNKCHIKFGWEKTCTITFVLLRFGKQSIFVHEILTICKNTWRIQFVIFKPLSYCFNETIRFDVKASFASHL